MNYAAMGVQAVGAAMQLSEAKRNKLILEQQGRTASSQSVANSEALMRDYRQLAGRQAATIAQSGGAADGTFAKFLAQSESLANLDRLNTLYSGEMKRLGFNEEGEATYRRGFMSAAKTLSGAAGGAGGGGGGMSIPGYG